MTNVNEVFVVKRDGTRAPWDFSKTFRAISWASQDLDFDINKIFDEELINSIVYDGIPTTQLQLLLAHMAESVSYKYPEADIIAARLLLQVVRKEINDPFNHGYTGYPHLKDTLHRAEKYGSRRVDKNLVEKFDLEILNAAIDKDRDLNFRYMGISTLFTSYLLRDTRDNSLIEGPQHFFMRVAMGLAHSEPEEKRHEVAIDLYNQYSSLAFLSSTPTNFNSCTVHPQLSSCFITTVESDSLEGIHSTGQELSQYSKFSGGTATDLTPLRSKGSKIAGTGGRSSGVIAFAKIYEACMRAFDQGGNRPGVICMYLESWHQDIVTFLESVDPKGDERTSLRDAHIANWVPDLLMQRVQEEKDWSLFNPKDVPDLHDLYGEDFKVAYEAYENNPDIERKVIPAKTLFKKMLETLFNRKGKGWICFKDEANRRNPSRAYGRIHSSNLCVAPETMVLTDEGHIEIESLVGQKVKVWNGYEFSEVDVVQTSEASELITVNLDNGAYLDCTPYHKFYIQENYSRSSIKEVRAGDLKPGMKLIKSKFPVLPMQDAPVLSDAYTHGFFCGDGTYNEGRKIIFLYDDKKPLSKYLSVSGTDIEDASGRLNYTVNVDIPEKFEVPSEYKMSSKLKWLAGLLDADGTVCRNGENQSLQLGSTNYVFLREIQLMLQTMGVDAKVKMMREQGIHKLPNSDRELEDYECSTMYRLLINSNDTQLLLNLGLTCYRLKLKQANVQRKANQFVKVLSVQNSGRIDATYCFTEPKRNLGVFNGILTGQCTEIMLINNSELSSVCNLGSINLANINSPEELVSVVKTGVRAIDNAITNGYVPNVKGQRFNDLERPLGLGLMGLTRKLVGDFHIDYESIEYLVANEIIMGIISMTAMDTSADLAQEKGAYKNFPKSSWAKGELIVDTAANDIDDEFFKNIDYYLDNHTPEVLKPYLEVYRSFDRDVLRAKVKQGMRNATLLAIAPTASIANIAGCTNCTELPNKLVYSKDNNSGKYNIIPELFVKLRQDGREDLVKTAYSVSQISTIRSAAVRQRWIDQAQSTNVFVYETVKGKDLAAIYLAAWSYHLKTTYYLRSQAPDIKNNMDSFVAQDETPVETPPVVEDASFCSIDDEGCLSCQ